MKIRKVRKIERAIILSLAVGALTLCSTAPSKAALYATKESAKVLPSDGHGSYLAQVYATNKVYKKANAGEAWFKAAMRRMDTKDKIVSKKTFFGGKKTIYANSPTASWPYAKCQALME